MKEAKRITEAIVVVFVVAAAGFVFGTAILIDVLGFFGAIHQHCDTVQSKKLKKLILFFSIR